MVASKLVELIEQHADSITESVAARVRTDPRLASYQRLAESELLRRFGDDCRNLGQWLGVDDDSLLAERYGRLGRERCQEGIPLHQVVGAAHLFKRSLIAFARRQCAEQTWYDIHSEEELEYLIGGFFDKAVYHVVKSYEEALWAMIDSRDEYYEDAAESGGGR